MQRGVTAGRAVQIVRQLRIYSEPRTRYRGRVKATFQRVWLALLLAAPLSSCAVSERSLAQDTGQEQQADATVRISGKLLAIGVGYKWGRGTLSYHGDEVSFCIHGISLGDVGAAQLTAEGVVYNLRSLDDFSGKYLAMSVGGAIARGESASVLQNERGVTIELESKVKGLRLTLAGTDLRIALAGSRSCAVHDGAKASPMSASRQRAAI